MIPRQLEPKIREWIGKNKAIVLLGPRQIGKTTLTNLISNSLDKKILWLTGDDPFMRTQLEGVGIAGLKQIIGDHTVVVIDEAQRIKEIGLTLKLITDHFQQVQLFVTGSSAIDLNSETKESLVGRKIEFQLYPFSFVEMADHHGYLTELAFLEHRLVYGYYPQVVNSTNNTAAQLLLNELSDGLMYRDLLSIDSIKKPSLLTKLLQAVAFQVGTEVSMHELGQMVSADAATVEKYLDLLEKSYVIFKLSSFSRNQRNEIKKGKKYYFYDNGIRNALVRNFSPLNLRTDKGALWENFLLAERKKQNSYAYHFHNAGFWRTIEKKEIDYIEESNGLIRAFEFKWNPQAKVRPPSAFLSAYPDAGFEIVHSANFADFVMVKNRTDF